MPETVYYFKRDNGFPLFYLKQLKEYATFSSWKPDKVGQNVGQNATGPRWPIITLLTLILTLTLNALQYQNGLGSIQNTFNLRPWIIFLYPFKLLGLDTLEDNFMTGLLTLMAAFLCLGYSELYFLSHSRLLFFLLLDTMFSWSQWSFLTSFCRGDPVTVLDLLTTSYCCSSFLLMASLGLALILTWKNASSTGWLKPFTLAFILFNYMLAVLNDYYYHFDEELINSVRVCESFSWHAMNYLFGLVCGFFLI
jgi:hypothetical protein